MAAQTSYREAAGANEPKYSTGGYLNKLTQQSMHTHGSSHGGGQVADRREGDIEMSGHLQPSSRGVRPGGYN